MCIAIYTPAGKVLPRTTLETCFENNDDGCGFAYINTSHTEVKKIFVKKTLDFEIFYRQYQRATRVNPDSPFLIHFRIKTHGTISKENCHPFMVQDDLVFIHNGMISGVGYDKEKSDTRLFNEKILQQLPEGWQFNEAVQTLIEDFINASKLVTMDVEGDIQIFNEQKGNWVDGCWYSNTSYKPRSTYVNSWKGKGKGGAAVGKGSSNFSGGSKKSSSSTTSKQKKFNEGGGTISTAQQKERLISQYSWLACEGCGKWGQINTLNPYEIYEDLCEIYCDTCESINLRDKIIRANEAITVAQYVKKTNDHIARVNGALEGPADNYFN